MFRNATPGSRRVRQVDDSQTDEAHQSWIIQCRRKGFLQSECTFVCHRCAEPNSSSLFIIGNHLLKYAAIHAGHSGCYGNTRYSFDRCQQCKKSRSHSKFASSNRHRCTPKAYSRCSTRVVDGSRGTGLLSKKSRIPAQRFRQIVSFLYRVCTKRRPSWLFADSTGTKPNQTKNSYFDSIQRMAAPNYLPTDQDVLRSRVKTTGITYV